MAEQAMLADRKRLVTMLPVSRTMQHTAVRPSADHAIQPAPTGALAESRFGQDFSQVAVQVASDAARSELAPSCPVTPTRCPFGGARHTCPVQVQTKLAMNQPGDEYEQEADWLADQAMRAPGMQLQRRAARQVEPANVPPIMHEVLHSPGQPLDAQTCAFTEPRFGHDFSRVRVHTDAKAVESARAVNALAYTVGTDVVFGCGQYEPAAVSGRHLLSHELAHVAQQSAGSAPTANHLRISSIEDALEHEAQTLAQKTVSSESSPTQRLSQTGVVLSRQEESSGTETTVTQELTFVLENLGIVQPSQAVADTIRQAIEPLARRVGRTLQFGRSAPGDLTLSFDPGGRESRPCGLLILGNEGGGDIFVGAHKDLRVCGGPRRDPQKPGEIDYISQIERVFDEEEDAFGRFVGNTAVHEL